MVRAGHGQLIHPPSDTNDARIAQNETPMIYMPIHHANPFTRLFREGSKASRQARIERTGAHLKFPNPDHTAATILKKNEAHGWIDQKQREKTDLSSIYWRP